MIYYVLVALVANVIGFSSGRIAMRWRVKRLLAEGQPLNEETLR